MLLLLPSKEHIKWQWKRKLLSYRENSYYSKCNLPLFYIKLLCVTRLKGRGWSKTGVCHISVNNQWIFTKFSAVVHYVKSHQIIKCQLICIIYAWISHNSKVPNEERYSEKTNDSKHMFSSVTCSLHSRGCNSYFEIC